MPPRTYDFSEYRSGLEAAVGGLLEGYNAVDDILNRRRVRRQEDEDRARRQQEEDFLFQEALRRAGYDPGTVAGAGQGSGIVAGQGPREQLTLPGTDIPIIGIAGPVALPRGDSMPIKLPTPSPKDVGTVLGGGQVPRRQVFRKTGESDEERARRLERDFKLEDEDRRAKRDLEKDLLDHEQALEIERLRRDAELERARIIAGTQLRTSERQEKTAMLTLLNQHINDISQQIDAIESIDPIKLRSLEAVDPARAAEIRALQSRLPALRAERDFYMRQRAQLGGFPDENTLREQFKRHSDPRVRELANNPRVNPYEILEALNRMGGNTTGGNTTNTPTFRGRGGGTSF